ncbi:MAG: thioredoxin domain-containing protein, partial [Bradymonadaceae bacterium]
PYLLEHAHNPVDWQPWDERALEEARERDVPIFLSIGYSACHWCHVMARESFEDEAIAELLNEHYVPIKVDREERPDLDRIYMSATQMLTGQGGWPMSVWLTPDREPFYAGTYFPPEDKHGRPGFATVLEEIAELWETDPDDARRSARKLTARLEQAAAQSGGEGELSDRPLTDVLTTLDRQFDETNGGFGGAPKFPPSMKLRLLLRLGGDASVDSQSRSTARKMAETTLLRMASGGMYDQIGGGFHRYSVDEEWLVPHFEKMLYDNAMLALAYTDAHQATGRDFYERIVDETLEWVDREMTFEESDAGRPYFSSRDAESEGEEGKYFVWTPERLRDVLDEADAERAESYWGITEAGNFENNWSIPNRLHALEPGLDEDGFAPRPDDAARIRTELFEARTERTPPGTDRKILASWNGLMIRAEARAGFVLDEPAYLESAESASTFVAEEMIEGELDDDFTLYRTYKEGRARIPGYLDDYASTAAAWTELFEATGDPAWLGRAERMIDRAVELFWDDGDAGFYYTAEGADDLLVREKDGVDNALPSGNSAAVGALLRLSVLTGRDELRERAVRTLRSFSNKLDRMPRALGEMLQGLHAHLRGLREIYLVVPEGADPEPMVEVLRGHYVPNAVQAIVDLGDASLSDWTDALPGVADREPRDGEPTAFVCRRGTCRAPTTDPDELAEQLVTLDRAGE